MDIIPTRNLVAQAIESARNGKVRDYLVGSAKSAALTNELTLRIGFQNMMTAVSESNSPSDAHRLCRDLNGYYKTRYSIIKLTSLVPIICDAITSRNWWRNGPPKVCDISGSELDMITSVVPIILNETRAAGLNRPYSLTTKFLHFCFPDSFGIYDGQAANSIQVWSYFSFSPDDSASHKFQWDYMSNPTGKGYHAIMDFYKLCWEHATREQLADLENAAEALTQEIGAPVSPIYIINNLIWHTDGDPRLLGLLRK